MLKKICQILLLIILSCCGCDFLNRNKCAQPAQEGCIEPIRKGERILILAPHPDDETIGCAGIIHYARHRGAQIKVLYLTNGDHNEFAFIVYEKRILLLQGAFIQMGRVRRQEAVQAMDMLGVPEKNLIFLGYPDFGTFAIFDRYWSATRPYSSMLTRISSVPYKENYNFGAPYIGESILRDMRKVLLEYKPDRIFVSHPADVNVDHKAYYLFLKVALAQLKDELPAPKIYPYLVHWPDWPKPRDYHPQLELNPPSEFSDSRIRWKKLYLTLKHTQRKNRATLCYRSQTQSSAFYLLSFARANELFGDYPDIKLTQQNPQEQLVFSRGQANVDLAVTKKDFLIRIRDTKTPTHRLKFIFYLFGYNEKVPFPKMPKICIISRYNTFTVLDAGKRIFPKDIIIKDSPEKVDLKIPLELLGNPDFILASVRTHGNNLPADIMGFRKVIIEKEAGNGGAKAGQDKQAAGY